MSFMDDVQLIKCNTCGRQYNGKKLGACPACQAESLRQSAAQPSVISEPKSNRTDQLLVELIEEVRRTSFLMRWAMFMLATILIFAFYAKGINVHILP